MHLLLFNGGFFRENEKEIGMGAKLEQVRWVGGFKSTKLNCREDRGDEHAPDSP